MPYSIPRSILPKFLWKHIIDYLSIVDLRAMMIVSKEFNSLLDDNDWKTIFSTKRCDISIVKCKTKHMDDFWKYACYNYIACVDINDMFYMIHQDNSDDKLFIYYKVLSKQDTIILIHIAILNA